ncbi:hypothetical protein Clacol_002414 [Clathrus columnatus]|uniref:Uncharacterized protein n=1 Tax=Clathrus columnatus TaxID=1419009 RepID=A0AAV5A0N1_9AGAM|nr:hypothetical protein Clacol_002414 [Clathrus columnatus]
MIPLDYFEDSESSNSSSSSSIRSLPSEVCKVDLQQLQPTCQPMMDQSKFSVVSAVPLERRCTGRTIVGDDHPGLLALRDETRELRCGRPCGVCKPLSRETIEDPEFCSETMTYRVDTISLQQELKGLVSLAAHYVPEVTSRDGFTLVFVHSTSNHKEQWEIIVSNLFKLHPGLVNDAWALDWQNHVSGYLKLSHDLNRLLIEALNDYADVVRQLLESPHLADKNVVGIVTMFFPKLLGIFQVTLPIPPLKRIVLFEPVYIIPPVMEKDERILRGVLNKRVEASQWARKRMPWRTWDERMFNCYMKYGFRNVSSDFEEVTLNCALEQEADAYSPNMPVLCGQLYSKLCSTYSVHGIFGDRPEMYSNKIRDMFYDGQDGRVMTSAQIIPRAGHLLVQEHPDTSAQMIANALYKEKARIGVVGKL